MKGCRKDLVEKESKLKKPRRNEQLRKHQINDGKDSKWIYEAKMGFSGKT